MLKNQALFTFGFGFSFSISFLALLATMMVQIMRIIIATYMIITITNIINVESKALAVFRTRWRLIKKKMTKMARMIT